MSEKLGFTSLTSERYKGNHVESTRVLEYPTFHEYCLEERHGPWKALFPFSFEAAVLAVGLKGIDLASLGRSWKVVHVYKCSNHDIDWAISNARNLGSDCRFEQIHCLKGEKSKYEAIAVDTDWVSVCDPVVAVRLLKSGGSVAWIGGHRNVPKVSVLTRRGFASILTFALLPPNSRKILISLENGRSTRTGLGLYVPVKWQNRLSLRLARTISVCGFQNLLGINQIVLARKTGHMSDGHYLSDWLGGQLRQTVANVTIYNGWTKLVLQLLDSHGNIIGLAKVSDLALGRALIRKETAVLNRLNKVADLRDSVPRVLYEGDWQGHHVQVQTAAPFSSSAFKKKLTRDHLSFLMKLSRVDRCEILLERWPLWSDLWEWAQSRDLPSSIESDAVLSGLQSCYHVLRNIKIPFHRVHGDFAPWNVIAHHDKLTVVDWEHSERLGLPLFDLAHFAAREITFIKEKTIPFDKLLKDCISILSISHQMDALRPTYSHSMHQDFTPAHEEALVRLCLIRDKMKTSTGK